MTTSRRLVLPLLVVLAAALGAILDPAASTAAAPAPEQRSATLLTWHGQEAKVNLPVRADDMPGAPRSFRVFARETLRRIWVQELDHEPACKASPELDMVGLRTDGFAIGGVGTYARPGCDVGGGYLAFWAVRHGQWKQVIGTQEVVSCARLERLDFPSEVGVDECYDGDDVVPYSHP